VVLCGGNIFLRERGRRLRRHGAFEEEEHREQNKATRREAYVPVLTSQQFLADSSPGGLNLPSSATSWQAEAMRQNSTSKTLKRSGGGCGCDMANMEPSALYGEWEQQHDVLVTCSV